MVLHNASQNCEGCHMQQPLMGPPPTQWPSYYRSSIWAWDLQRRSRWGLEPVSDICQRHSRPRCLVSEKRFSWEATSEVDMQSPLKCTTSYSHSPTVNVARHSIATHHGSTSKLHSLLTSLSLLVTRESNKLGPRRSSYDHKSLAEWLSGNPCDTNSQQAIDPGLVLLEAEYESHR